MNKPEPTKKEFATVEYATAVYTGRGEFYSGVKKGERVIVEIKTWKATSSVSISVQSQKPKPGPWLTVYHSATELNDLHFFASIDDARASL